MATFFSYRLKSGEKYWGFETYLGKDPKTGKDIRTKRRRFKTKTLSYSDRGWFYSGSIVINP